MTRHLLLHAVRWAWAAALLVPASLPASHTGTDYFLLSYDGKHTRTTDWGHGSVVDSQSELVFRWKDGKIVATPFDSDKPLWTAPSPFASRGDAYWVADVPGVFLVIDDRGTSRAIYGLDKATGKELYHLPLTEAWFPPPYHPSFQWPVKPGGEGKEAFYLVRFENPAERDSPVKALVKYDLRTGKLLWEKPVPRLKEENFAKAMLDPGMLRGRKSSFYFDPTTGEALTKIDAQKTQQVAYFHNLIHHLSTDDPAVLTAYRPGTWEEVWSVKGLAGVRHILRPHVTDRLLCATDTEIVVIDTKARRERSRFPAVAMPYANLFETQGLIVAPTGKGYHAFDPETGKMRWHYENKNVCDRLRQSGPLLFAVEDRPAKEAEGASNRDRILTVVALGLDDGKERWRRQLPEYKEFYDGIYAEVMPCKSGLLVKRSWYIGER